MQIEPYLFFEGRCEEAIEFYRMVLSAQVLALMKNSQNPEQSHVKPGTQDKVMHATIKIGSTTLMLSDGMCTGSPKFEGFSLSIAAASASKARDLFESLADGGEIRFPMQETFWSPCFGMVADKFGVCWMVTTAEQGSPGAA